MPQTPNYLHKATFSLIQTDIRGKRHHMDSFKNVQLIATWPQAHQPIMISRKQ